MTLGGRTAHWCALAPTPSDGRISAGAAAARNSEAAFATEHIPCGLATGRAASLRLSCPDDESNSILTLAESVDGPDVVRRAASAASSFSQEPSTWFSLAHDDIHDAEDADSGIGSNSLMVAMIRDLLEPEDVDVMPVMLRGDRGMPQMIQNTEPYDSLSVTSRSRMRGAATPGQQLAQRSQIHQTSVSQASMQRCRPPQQPGAGTRSESLDTSARGTSASVSGSIASAFGPLACHPSGSIAETDPVAPADTSQTSDKMLAGLVKKRYARCRFFHPADEEAAYDYLIWWLEMDPEHCKELELMNLSPSLRQRLQPILQRLSAQLTRSQALASMTPLEERDRTLPVPSPIAASSEPENQNLGVVETLNGVRVHSPTGTTQPLPHQTPLVSMRDAEHPRQQQQQQLMTALQSPVSDPRTLDRDEGNGEKFSGGFDTPFMQVTNVPESYQRDLQSFSVSDESLRVLQIPMTPGPWTLRTEDCELEPLSANTADEGEVLTNATLIRNPNACLRLAVTKQCVDSSSTIRATASSLTRTSASVERSMSVVTPSREAAAIANTLPDALTTPPMSASELEHLDRARAKHHVGALDSRRFPRSLPAAHRPQRAAFGPPSVHNDMTSVSIRQTKQETKDDARVPFERPVGVGCDANACWTAATCTCLESSTSNILYASRNAHSDVLDEAMMAVSGSSLDGPSAIQFAQVHAAFPNDVHVPSPGQANANNPPGLLPQHRLDLEPHEARSSMRPLSASSEPMQPFRPPSKVVDHDHSELERLSRHATTPLSSTESVHEVPSARDDHRDTRRPLQHDSCLNNTEFITFLSSVDPLRCLAHRALVWCDGLLSWVAEFMLERFLLHRRIRARCVSAGQWIRDAFRIGSSSLTRSVSLRWWNVMAWAGSTHSLRLPSSSLRWRPGSRRRLVHRLGQVCLSVDTAFVTLYAVLLPRIGSHIFDQQQSLQHSWPVSPNGSSALSMMNEAPRPVPLGLWILHLTWHFFALICLLSGNWPPEHQAWTAYGLIEWAAMTSNILVIGSAAYSFVRGWHETPYPRCLQWMEMDSQTSIVTAYILAAFQTRVPGGRSGNRARNHPAYGLGRVRRLRISPRLVIGERGFLKRQPLPKPWPVWTDPLFWASLASQLLLSGLPILAASYQTTFLLVIVLVTLSRLERSRS
ncbi:hypothetical protein F1559_005003 [Cyanidiococcus yangmingshanensis]|uniref:Transmembrane protein n=1 Tax=Cyanidiococcus yangmingshanensis TaxID=2690220 RepID=A0A7J7INT4_9RHOD|nr:hypothetical protein F1559_005003 [Cyanidiococcus yangmingshanensis]